MRGGGGAGSLYSETVPIPTYPILAYLLTRAPYGREKVQRGAATGATQEYRTQTLTDGKQIGPTGEFLFHDAPSRPDS